MNRGWKCVVRTLPHIYMVVWMDLLFRFEAITTVNLDRPVSNHFIHIHIARSTGTRLKYVDREFII